LTCLTDSYPEFPKKEGRNLSNTNRLPQAKSAFESSPIKKAYVELKEQLEAHRIAPKGSNIQFKGPNRGK